jgi:hypothetical protein
MPFNRAILKGIVEMPVKVCRFYLGGVRLCFSLRWGGLWA